jgi:hypothetical protein
MEDLLEKALAAHGGLGRWNDVKAITVDASITGAFWHLKNKGDALKAVRFEVDTKRERLTMEYVGQDKRSVFEPSRVEIYRVDGTFVDARDDPERSFDGQAPDSPWDDLQLAYFTGEALWTYLNMPFLCTGAGFVTEEIDPVEVESETWRRLNVTFPDHVKTHSRQQTLCFGPDALLRRHDFTIDILGGIPSALNATDYRNIDGIVIPATRRAFASQDDDRAATETLMVAIEMDNITVR